MKSIHHKSLLISTALLLTTTTSLNAGETLTKDQIQELVTGKTIHADHLKKDFRFKVYFNADGTAIRRQMGETTITKWFMEGNKHCLTWRGRDRCATIQENADGTFSRINRKGKSKVLWKAFEDGNTI